MIKWVDDSYEGPPVRYTKQSRAQVLARLNVWVRERTEHLYQDALAEWARADAGPFPRRADLAQQAKDEVEQLCRALGPWAAVNPGELGFSELDLLNRYLRSD